MAAGFIYLEYKFAKINETETRGNLSAIEVVLKKIGAEKVEYDPAGWIRFWIEDEVLWINLSYAPMIEVLLQNSVDGCPDMEIAQEIAAKLTSRLAGGRVTIKEGSIFICWASLLSGYEAWEEGLPIILGYLFQVREEFISSYWKTLATKQQHTNQPVS